MSTNATADRTLATAFTRRRLLGGVAGLAVLAAQGGQYAPQHVQTAEAQGTPNAGSATSWLLVAPGSRDTGWFSGNEVAVYSGDGRELARLPLDKIKGKLAPTGDPRSALALTWSGLRLMRLDPPAVETVDAELDPKGLYELDEPRGQMGVGHPRWAVVTSLPDPADPKSTFRVLLVALDRRRALPIESYLADGHKYPPSEQRFSASGAYLTLWGGVPFPSEPPVHAWLVPTADVNKTRALVADKADWLTTAATVSPDDRLVAYTAYPSVREEGRMLIQDIAGQDPMELARANAWSQAIWLPDPSRRLLTLGAGELMLHEIGASGATAATQITRDAPLFDLDYRLSPDGAHLLYGSRASVTAPPVWHWVDLTSGRVVPLAALDGLAPYRSSGINQWPRWVMFGPDSMSRHDPGVGLDMATGTTTPLIELMQRPDRVATSVDGRIALLGTAWDTTVPARLVDLSTGKVTPLRFGRDRMARSGVVRPDGGLVAVHTMANKDHALQVVPVDPADPATAEPLSPGAAVLWTEIR